MLSPLQFASLPFPMCPGHGSAANVHSVCVKSGINPEGSPREVNLQRLLLDLQQRQEAIMIGSAELQRVAMASMDDLRALTHGLAQAAQASPTNFGSLSQLAVRVPREKSLDSSGSGSRKRDIFVCAMPPMTPQCDVCCMTAPVPTGAGDSESPKSAPAPSTSSCSTSTPSATPPGRQGLSLPKTQRQVSVDRVELEVLSGDSPKLLQTPRTEMMQAKSMQDMCHCQQSSPGDGETKVNDGKVALAHSHSVDSLASLGTRSHTVIGRFVVGPYLNGCTTLVITANVLFTAFSTQYAMQHLDKPSSSIMNSLELCFHGYYIIELVLKAWVLRLQFFKGPDLNWNLFDAVLVLTAFYDIVTVVVGAEGFNVTFLRVFRLFKMLKVLRLVRVLKRFRELRLMIQAILGSLSTFFWCSVMLACILFLCSLVIVQSAAGYLSDLDDFALSTGGKDIDTAKLVEYWGTLPAAINTMFQAITGGGDWGEFATPLLAIGYHIYFFFLLCIGFLTLAVLNVLTGIFCANALDAAVMDRDNVAYMAAKQSESFKRDVRALFQLIDDDCSGSLSLTEFERHIGNPEMTAYLSALEIEVKDAKFFFHLLSQHSPNGEVSTDVFLDGCQRLKGDAKMIDIQAICSQITVLYKSQEQLQRFVESMFQRLLNDPATCLLDSVFDGHQLSTTQTS